MAVIQHHRSRDALSPLWIGHADYGTFRHRGMFTQRFLNLQRGHLMSTRLEDVHVRPAKNAIDAALNHRSIAGAKPALAEGIACGVGLAPVFQAHVWTAAFDFARRSWRNRFAILSDKLNFDARQWCTDAPRHALASQRVRQRHANLRHAVALEKSMAADFLPALEC